MMGYTTPPAVTRFFGQIQSNSAPEKAISRKSTKVLFPYQMQKKIKLSILSNGMKKIHAINLELLGYV